MSDKDYKGDIGNKGTCKAGTATNGNTDLTVSGRLVFIGNYPQHQTHSSQKRRSVFHLKVCQLLAISYYSSMTRYEVEHPFPPSPEEQCKGQEELYPALDNNKSWIH